MINLKSSIAHSVACAVLFTSSVAQSQTPATRNPAPNEAYRSEFRIDTLLAQVRPSRRAGFSLMGPTAAGVGPMAAGGLNIPVVGGGTIGRLPKWTGFTSANSVISDSTIFEDKYGLVGIGTDTPTSKLTVQGMIETTMGGYKFPDGTVQTSAGLAAGQAVMSLNGLKGDVTLKAGFNILISQNNNELTIASTALSQVIHDETLTGDGTNTPLRVSLPLVLAGPAGDINSPQAAVRIVNFTDQGPGMIVRPGNSENGFGGDGISVSGGKSTNLVGGIGVRALGGSGKLMGGEAVLAEGGVVDNAPGVIGDGGRGIHSEGGDSNTGDGGDGALLRGGTGTGVGKFGGIGVLAIGGMGEKGAVKGLAGSFVGDVEVEGNFSVTGGGTKNFKIDHPLDPENKYLYHAAIESSEVLNIYSGNIRLDGGGEAIVKLPEWFEALNKDFRYALTPIGAPGPGLYIAQEVSKNQFRVAGGLPGTMVSWQVTGIRSDAAIRHRPFRLEEDKDQSERGYYLIPEAYGQPAERSIMRSRNPETTKRLEQRTPDPTHNRSQR